MSRPQTEIFEEYLGEIYKDKKRAWKEESIIKKYDDVSPQNFNNKSPRVNKTSKKLDGTPDNKIQKGLRKYEKGFRQIH